MYTASCLCGGIQLRLNAEIARIHVCHCTQCQKAQGGAFVAVAPVAKNQLEVLEGAQLMGDYFASPGKKRVFCSRCAAPLYSERLDVPGVVRLRVGVINEPLHAVVHAHAFTRHKAPWLTLPADEPQYLDAAP